MSLGDNNGADTIPNMSRLENDVLEHRRAQARLDAEVGDLSRDVRRYLESNAKLHLRIEQVLLLVEQRGFTRGYVQLVALAAGIAAGALVWMAMHMGAG